MAAFNRFFSLEEAAQSLPDVRRSLEKVQEALYQLYQEVVLYKRMVTLSHVQGDDAKKVQALSQVLEQKIETFEATYEASCNAFKEQGLWLRDVDKGVVNFPYKSREGDLFLLCWAQGEEGVFYFHEASKTYRARKPISLLPD